VLGLLDVLARRVGRPAFFRPLVATEPDSDVELVVRAVRAPQSGRASFALTEAGLVGLSRDAVLERVLDGFSAVSAGADVAVVEGSDLTGSAAAEVDLNAAAAVHLGASVRRTHASSSAWSSGRWGSRASSSGSRTPIW